MMRWRQLGMRGATQVAAVLGVMALRAACSAAGERAGAAGSDQAGEVRAVWVTRWAYETARDIGRIMANCREAGLHDILFQVRGNGTVFYRSAIEPWAWETHGAREKLGVDPGWDPLAVAVREAHRQGLRLHAYMNVYPGWRGTEPPRRGAGQLWETHRDWFMVDREGAVMTPKGSWSNWYSFLSPGHPEVQSYLTRVFLEVVRQYQVDGIHYDYLRYPGEVGDFSYNPADLRAFTRAAGGSPEQRPEAFDQWRRDQVVGLTARIRREAAQIRAKPALAFSSAVVGDYSGRGLSVYFQDAHRMLEVGALDMIMPMLYTDDDAELGRRLDDHMGQRRKGRVVAGLMPAKVDPAGLRRQIELCRRKGADGVALFDYTKLFPKHEAGPHVAALPW